MTGKAYNPEGWEPEAHERFGFITKEIVELYRKTRAEWRTK
jgi:hypothetical protein